MEKRYNLLSLDPMYSSLHEKIGKLFAVKKYAVTSCLSKKIYLPSFKLTLATELIRKSDVDENIINIIKNMETFHHSFVEKIEMRNLARAELEYMARFYIGLKGFILKKSINLVLLHNDTRWYHAIAIRICNELGIEYLVTEQGLIRPSTTVIDNQGVNAKANMSFLDVKPAKRFNKLKNISHTHESYISMFLFLFFLCTFYLERNLRRGTILRYMHNQYSIRKYFLRFINRKNRRAPISGKIEKNSALLLMQLETDSQFLMYSDFKNNQELIEELSKKCNELGVRLAIKKHPLDFNNYNLPDTAYYVNGDIRQLSESSVFIATVNSSSIITALKTSKKIYILGRSIYHYNGMVEHCSIDDIRLNSIQAIDERKIFIHKLKSNYLLHGAGYSYCDIGLYSHINNILSDNY